jgi:hypothetical protein
MLWDIVARHEHNWLLSGFVLRGLAEFLLAFQFEAGQIASNRKEPSCRQYAKHAQSSS